MTAVNDIIEKGQRIPDDVTEVDDSTDGNKVWTRNSNSDGWNCPGTALRNEPGAWVSATYGPLTVTAVREQPAAEYPRCDACGSEDPPDGCHIGCPKLAAAPLVLSLPTVPDGAVALIADAGTRYKRIESSKHDSMWSNGASGPVPLSMVLETEGSVTVVMREPRTWPKLDAPDASAVRGASGRIWRRVSPTVWACRDDEGGEECENFAALQQYDGPLVEVLDDKEGTR